MAQTGQHQTEDAITDTQPHQIVLTSSDTESEGKESETHQDQTMEGKTEVHQPAALNNGQDKQDRSDSISSNSDELLSQKEEDKLSIAGSHHKSDGKISSFLSLAALPVLNVICTAVLMGVLIYVYSYINLKPVNYAVAGMAAPTLVSLLITLIKMLVSAGIGYGLSEYKWVRFEKYGGKLSLLDVYDACTRGVGGVIRVVGSIFKADFILISGSILQLALLAMNPAGQQILSKTIGGTETTFLPGIILFANSPADKDLTGVDDTYDLSVIKGLLQPYLVQSSMEQVAQGYALSSLKVVCPPPLIRCEFENLAVFYTSAECQPGSLQTKVIDATNGNITTVNDLLGFNSSKSPFPFVLPNTLDGRNALPQFYYAESMAGRTHWDLAKIPVEKSYGKENPNAQRLIGDQVFVVATNDGSTKVTSANSTNTVVHQCTLRSFLNNTKVTYSVNRFETVSTASKPITLDYALLANNSKLMALAGGAPRLDDQGYVLNQPNFTQMNAYGLQLSVMQTLTTLGPKVGFAGSLWGIASEYLDDPNAFSYLNYLSHRYAEDVPLFDFFRVWMRQIGINVAFSAPPSNQQALSFAATGTGYEVLPLLYMFRSTDYLGVALSFLIPLVWWLCLWIFSLYRTNGLARGNSQIALLATGFTAAAREQFGEYSHAGQGTLFSRADKIDICFGEIPSEDGKPGQVAFGLKEEELPMLRRRRGSMDDSHPA
ncbi:hypothetical protein EC973_002398 [Apophysomyces ossiformis]|uniref:Uncharacterized protein n=1 Tax=Apophysomyces ossiformis TaxID=679940 RepID=A0A8H7BNU7_9FUNG|nr:hypothetical protein EC973_002398 [Apophysomyces ossiformis]